MSPEWATLGWSVIASVAAAIFVLTTFWYSIKKSREDLDKAEAEKQQEKDLAAAVAAARIEERDKERDRRLAELENVNKKHFADRDELGEKIDKATKELREEIHKLQRMLDRWEGEDNASSHKPRRPGS